MSYNILYNPELKMQYPPIRKSRKEINTKPLFILLFVVIAGYILVQSGAAQFLLPGDAKITTAAFSSMIKQVGAGEPVGDAVVTFFQDVIANGS